MAATTSIHYVVNGGISDASDINQFADILTGITNAPGITVNSLTVTGGPINFPANSISATALSGALVTSGSSIAPTVNNIVVAGSTTLQPCTISLTALSDPNVNLRISAFGPTGVIEATSEVVGDLGVTGNFTGIPARLIGGSVGAPAAGAHRVNDFAVDYNAGVPRIWICTVAGTPGTFVAIS